MKKILALLLALTLALSLAACAKEEPEITTVNTTEVSEEETTASSAGDTTETTEEESTEPSTQETEPTGVTESTQEPKRVSYVYDEAGNLIEIQENGTRVWAGEYDEQGRLIEEGEYYGEEWIVGSDYVYNEDGSFTEYSCLTYGSSESYYDCNGVLQKVVCYGDGEDPEACYTYAYNEHGDLTSVVEEDFLYEQEVSTDVYRNEYDENGNLVKVYWLREGELDYVYTYTYDDAGNRIGSEEYFSTGELACRYTWTYDENGVLVESAYYDGYFETTELTQYSYDDSGRLVEEVTSDQEKD